MTLDELAARCKGGLTVSINDHLGIYKSRDTRVAELVAEDEIDADEATRLSKVRDLYELQFYPDTPVGFYVVRGASLEECLTQAEQCLRREWP